MSSQASSAEVGEVLLELPGRGRALFTQRTAGNLSTSMGDGHEQGMRRRVQLCERHDLHWVCSSHQVHGTAVYVIDHQTGSGGEPVALEADGHATALTGVGAMVMAADCLPVALGCDGAVAMVHAGWRGLAAGALERGVRTLCDLAGGEPIEAIVGPCAGVCCYEVGPEVHAAFDRAPRADGHLDMRAIAHERLADAGVGHVRDVEACTICDERFFSYRREGTRAGRQAGVAWLS
ncbi:MAG: polyphenol oxidase family protein [Solirubrobacteraceae bacterium]|jgi:YfiH family protein